MYMTVYLGIQYVHDCIHIDIQYVHDCILRHSIHRIQSDFKWIYSDTETHLRLPLPPAIATEN